MTRTSPYEADFLGVQVLQRLVEWLNAKWEAKNNPAAPMGDSGEPDAAYWGELEYTLTARSLHHGSVRGREAVQWAGTVYVFEPTADGTWELQNEIRLTI